MGTLLLVSAFYLFVAANAAPAQTRPPGDLRETMIALDRMLFDAYNRCDLESFRSYLIDGNLEFYHDKTGLTTSADDLVAAVEQNICGKVRRELEPGTLEVYPIPGYGAVQVGAHRFYHVGKEGAPETGGTVLARFLLIWKNINGKWKLTRVVSYAH